jgi:hypothetical protein
MGKRRGVYRILVGKPEGKRPRRRPRHNGKMILRWMFGMWDGVAWTGSIWLRIGPGGGNLWMW